MTKEKAKTYLVNILLTILIVAIMPVVGFLFKEGLVIELILPTIKNEMTKDGWLDTTIQIDKFVTTDAPLHLDGATAAQLQANQIVSRNEFDILRENLRCTQIELWILQGTGYIFVEEGVEQGTIQINRSFALFDSVVHGDRIAIAPLRVEPTITFTISASYPASHPQTIGVINPEDAKAMGWDEQEKQVFGAILHIQHTQ